MTNKIVIGHLIRGRDLGEKMAKKQILEDLLKTLGLDEYIAEQIQRHEEQYHE